MSINRSTLYYKPVPIKRKTIELTKKILEIYVKYPFMGYRRIREMLKRLGYIVNRRRVRRLMKLSSIRAIYPNRNLSKRRIKEMKHPCLLKRLPIEKVNDAWCVDITYIKLSQGYVYLTTLIDMVSRRIMGWTLSPFLEAKESIKGFMEAIIKARPKIINTDLGSQFTGKEWIETMRKNGIKVSMDEHPLDNVVIERFFRSLKYEDVYLRSYEGIPEARLAIKEYIGFYNNVRPHQSLGYHTPNEFYELKK